MDVIAELRATLPPVFLGSKIDKLTGHAIAWGTVQNKRSQRVIPDECFVRSGLRVLVLRDPFLDWWATTLSPARRPPVAPPRRGPEEVAMSSERWGPPPKRRKCPAAATKGPLKKIRNGNAQNSSPAPSVEPALRGAE
jgi:hypothetical protein